MRLPPPILNRKYGFTLIELSIVLVIIGLIVGGIVAGRAMIENAKLRATISDIDKYKSATNAFRGKYNCYPGDCVNAISYGLGQASGPGDNGDGNGAIGPGQSAVLMNWSSAKESLNFWYHLQQAGLINATASGWLNSYSAADNSSLLIPFSNHVPTINIGTNTVVMPYSFTSTIMNPAADLIMDNGFALIAPSAFSQTGYPLSAIQAYGIDTKIDDGLPCAGIAVTTYSEHRLRASCNGTSYNLISASATYGLVVGKSW